MKQNQQVPYAAPGVLIDENCAEEIKDVLLIKKKQFEGINEGALLDKLEVIEEETEPGRLPPIPHLLHHPLKALFWIIQAVFGMVSLVILLAVIAAIPVLNLFTLGYLLDVQGRVGRTGKLKNAFPLLDVAPRFGSIALGIWLWILPVRLLASATADAHLLAPGSGQDNFMHLMNMLFSFAVFVHLALALARGGAFSCFFRPIKNIRWILAQWKKQAYFDDATTHITQFISDLKIRHHFSLGFRGFAGAAIWLFPPTLLFAATADPETQGLRFFITLVGGFLLAIIFCWLPVLQTQFAVENRFGAFFEIRKARHLMARRPLMWVLVLLLTYALSLPMNLFKVVTPPQDAMWFITLIFILGIYPTKVMLGWLYHFSLRKEERALWWWRWPVGWIDLPIVGFYVFLLFFTQFIGEQGKAVLFQNHVFMLPIPF